MFEHGVLEFEDGKEITMDKLQKNWHIIVMAFGLIVSLWLHFDPAHEHEAEFAEAAFEAVSTVVAEWESGQ